jgi:hypothetical protein
MAVKKNSTVTTTKTEILYETTKYSLEHQWDVFKHTDSNVSTILASAGTLLSIFLGIQIYGFKILEKLALNYQTFFFIVVVGCLFISIIFTIFALRNYITLHIDPIEIIAHSSNKSDLIIRQETTKALAFSWFKNQNTISKKNFYIRLAYISLLIGLILLPCSFIFSGLEI